MPTYTADAWSRLGDLLVRRRVELDPRYKNRRTFCAEREIEYKVISDIETAKRTNFSGRMLAHLEIAYAIAAGSIDTALRGGELTPRATEAGTSPGTSAALEGDPWFQSLLPGQKATVQGFLDDPVLKPLAKHLLIDTYRKLLEREAADSQGS